MESAAPRSLHTQAQTLGSHGPGEISNNDGLMRRWLRSRWNTMLERRLAKMTQGETPEEVVQGLRFLSKRPRMQLRGLIGACNVLVERGEMDAAKGVAGDICALVGSGRTGHKGTVYGLERAAHIYGRCGDAERSVAVWEMALEHERAKHGPEAVPTVAATQYLAGAVRSTGDLSRAVELQRWALRCLRHRDGSASERVLKAEEELAITLYEQHEYAEAQGLLEHVVDGLGDARPEARVPRLWLASTLNKQGDREGA